MKTDKTAEQEVARIINLLASGVIVAAAAHGDFGFALLVLILFGAGLMSGILGGGR